jgi:hypothetical protein
MRLFRRSGKPGADHQPGASDLGGLVLERAVNLCLIDTNEQTEASIAAGPTSILGTDFFDARPAGEQSMALSLSRMGWALRLSEVENVEAASDRDNPEWLVVGTTLQKAVEQFGDAADLGPATVAAAEFLSRDEETTGVLLRSVPGLAAAHREQMIDGWLDQCQSSGFGASQISLGDQRRLLVYGYAMAAVREYALVAQERGDAEREDRAPRL